jgi:hypothetical protein
MLILLIALAAVFVLAVGADIFLRFHPFKKQDQKVEKFRYKGW